MNNNLLSLDSIENIKDCIAKYDHLILPENRNAIIESFDSTPDRIEFKDFTLKLGDYDFTNVNFDKIKTLIIVTVPQKINQNSSPYLVNDVTLEFKSLNNIFDNPIYSILDQLGGINGIPFALFSNRNQESTLIVIALNEFYHPDFDIVEGKILYKTCVELKNAHMGLMHGLTKQLPAYMDGKQTKNGIYLVLWYRNKQFDKPVSCESIEKMNLDLERNIPKGYNIKVMIINCTIPVVPSKG